jgi:aromatic ring-opening dioxygenase catalytic subunit (LigB family)
MAELVGVFAASHGPMIAREWERLTDDVRKRIESGFDELGRRLKASRPDVLIIVAPDHWCNFFLNNMPAVCIGIGEEHDGPPEPFLKPVFKHETLAGHPQFARHLLDTALANDSDPSYSHRLTLDHGFCLPLWRLGVDPVPPIVPFAVNEIEAPMPTLRRCLQWGRIIREAIESYPENLRVAILATGGLSHYIGEPGMGDVDEKFDRTCIALFEDGHEGRMAATLEAELKHTGNGGDEVRNWVIAHGAAGSAGFDLVGYEPLAEIYVGCAFAEWKIQKREQAAA